jgi:tetratricopeptide (TPR) repeat protein
VKKFFVLITLFISFVTVSLTAEQKDALEAYKQGHFQESIDICLDELKSTPQNLDSYVVLCWSLQKMEKYQEALDYAAQAQKINANDFRIIEIVAESDFFLGKNTDALGFFQQYAMLAPAGDRIDRAYYFMGEIYLQLGQYGHADIALTTAVYHAPQVPAWWARLGYARMMEKDYVWAKKAYEEALRQNPNLGEAQRGKQQVENLLVTH